MATKHSKRVSSLAKRRNNRTESKTDALTRSVVIPVPTHIVAQSHPFSLPKLAWKLIPNQGWTYVVLP